MQRPSSDSEKDSSREALFLSPEPPFPLNGGGPLRSASILHFLARRFNVHLVTFQERGSSPNTTAAGPLPLTPTMIDLPHHARNLSARIGRNAVRLLRRRLPLSDRFCGSDSLRQVERAIDGERYAIAVIEHSWCAPYFDLLRPRADRLILDLHNVESVLHARCAATEPWPRSAAHARFARIAARDEMETFAKFDLVLTPSESDRRTVLDLCPTARIAVVPNTLPETPEPNQPEEHVVAFSGNFEYHPNTTAVRHFREQIWPLLRQADPALRWRLIGRNEHAIRRYVQGDDRIEVTGPVDNAVRELARAKLVVVPLLSGSGTRIKVLEAWAAARAIVSTSIGAEGLPIESGKDILLVDEPRAMADTILNLLADEPSRKRIGRAGRSKFEQEGCWPEAWRALEQLALGDSTGSSTVTASRCDNEV